MGLLHLYQLWRYFILWLSLDNIKYVDLVYIRQPAFDNRSKEPESAQSFISPSRFHCGTTCYTSGTCISFIFIPGQSPNCQLYDIVLDLSDVLSTVQNAAYYVLETATETTTAVPSTPVPPPPFLCPTDDTIFRKVLLEDGNYFTYKVVKNLASHSGAKTECATQGGYLARVTTVAEMNVLLQLTRTCPGYTEFSDYYVDGSNAGDSDGAWVMDNGDPVPMTDEFWDDSGVTNPDTKQCFRMRASDNFLWDDCLCSNTYYFICEKNINLSLLFKNLG